MKLKTGRKLVFLLAFASCVCLLAGCAQMSMGVDVKLDGSGSVSGKLVFSEQAYAMLSKANSGTDQIENMMQNAREYGYQAERYEESGSQGFTITQDFNSLAQKLGSDPYTNGLSFTSSKGSGKRTFTLQGNPVMAGDVKAAIAQIGSADGAQVLFQVHMPFGITETNATQLSADRRTATWDLMQFDGELSMTAIGWDKLFGILPVWMAWIVLGALALVALALIVIGCVKVARKKRKTKMNQYLSGQRSSGDSQLPEDTNNE